MATGSPPTKLRSYPPMKMVLVEALGSSDDKNGMSLAGIKSYVAQTYPDLAEKSNFKTILKRCILKGLETGDLARSKKSQDYAGVQGKFKEVEIINNVRDLLQNCIAQAEKQIRLSRDAKQNLEMDWSDKKEALEIDTFCGNLRNHHTNKQFHEGAAKFEEIQSTPESWAQFSHDNIARGEHERMASIQLRTLIDNVLDDTSRDMREQCDTVDVNFQKRLTEMEDAKAKLQDNLKKVCKEIADQEKNIDDLQAAIRAKEDPLKVAQTRLNSRSYRPNVDLCRDPVQYGLVGEVNEICQSIDALKNQLNQAQNSLKDLQDNRMSLEKEISVKKNSIFIDRDKCMTVRTRYPSTVKLQGYQ